MTLLEKQWLFSQLLARFIWELRDAGYNVTLGEAYRTPDAALLNSKQGDGIKNSLHVDRLAIDLNLFVGRTYLTQLDDYRKAGMLWESYSTEKYRCCWGGHFKDAFHFSIEHGGRR